MNWTSSFSVPFNKKNSELNTWSKYVKITKSPRKIKTQTKTTILQLEKLKIERQRFKYHFCIGIFNSTNRYTYRETYAYSFLLFASSFPSITPLRSALAYSKWELKLAGLFPKRPLSPNRLSITAILSVKRVMSS